MENVFFDIVERKNTFQGSKKNEIIQNELFHIFHIKNNKFRKSKIDIFPKGLVYGFSPKLAIFPTYFF